MHYTLYVEPYIIDIVLLQALFPLFFLQKFCTYLYSFYTIRSIHVCCNNVMTQIIYDKEF